MKLVTIRVPEDATRLQYAIEQDGYERWQIVGFGEIVAVNDCEEMHDAKNIGGDPV